MAWQARCALRLCDDGCTRTAVTKGWRSGSSPGNIYFDDHAVIVRPEIAEAQLEADRPAPPPSCIGPNAAGSSTSTTGEPPEPKLATRFHATSSLDPQRANKDMALIVEEIIQRLTSLTGTEVEVTVEISAHRPEGFDDATVRTISENSRTLKFRNHGFERILRVRRGPLVT